MAKDEKDIEGEEGGGGKKKLIIIIAAVVLLLGGGAAAFLLMGGEEPQEGEQAAKEQPAAEEAVPEGDPIYLEMKPKFVVNLPPGGPAKMLQIAVTVYTRQQPVADFVSANDPMLRHHLNNLFEAQQASDLLTLEGKQKLQQAVKELLQQKLEEMDQKGEIKDVYFTEFVLQ
ncbi:MAG: flagellar biosynthesis protein FliL [Gammaproteobacteria bacterium]|nr:MAG: flagellar biosynthesis protein FliL [Gammaproteobacteria bacterium]